MVRRPLKPRPQLTVATPPRGERRPDATCADCGWADDGRGPCGVLLDALLAVEFSRRQPWGRLHGVTVPAFWLQHAGTDPLGDRSVRWAVLRTYLDGGIDALETAIAAARRRRHAGGPRPPEVSDYPVAAEAAPPTPRMWSTTIGHVAAADGSFPAEGHTARVEAWVRGVVADLRRS